MDILSLFVVVPVITILVLIFSKNLKQTRVIAAVGMFVQFAMSLNLIFAYFKEKQVNDSIMVFTKDFLWFEKFNIHYTIGVDGISVAMITSCLYRSACGGVYFLENGRLCTRSSLLLLSCWPQEFLDSLFPLIFSPCFCFMK